MMYLILPMSEPYLFPALEQALAAEVRAQRKQKEARSVGATKLRAGRPSSTVEWLAHNLERPGHDWRTENWRGRRGAAVQMSTRHEGVPHREGYIMGRDWPATRQ
jgi:hypothetical protein